VPQAGVIFDIMAEAGSFTEKYLRTSYICQTCKSIENKVFAQSNQKAWSKNRACEFRIILQDELITEFE